MAFFDCRSESYALYVHFGVALQGVIDIELMEVAARPTGTSKAHLVGLGGALERKDCDLPKAKRLACQLIRRNGKHLFVKYEGCIAPIVQRESASQGIHRLL